MLGVLARYMFEATRIAPMPYSNPTIHPRHPHRKGNSHPKTDRRAQKRADFARLHRGDGAFLMPNVWDAGSARLLEGLGFHALATTSAGLAFSMGLRDSSGSLSRAQVIDNARAILDATRLPVSADLENGFGPSPEACAETIRQAAQIGLSGGALEDATGDASDPIYEFDLAVDRIRAAAEAKPEPDFVLTARSENFLFNRPDLNDTIRRLQAFEDAGADVVYAPSLPDIHAIRTVCQAVSIPVNVVVGLSEPTGTVHDLAAAGVRRISTGGSLARAALGALIRSATELKDSGTCGYAKEAISDAQASAQMRAPVPR